MSEREGKYAHICKFLAAFDLYIDLHFFSSLISLNKILKLLNICKDFSHDCYFFHLKCLIKDRIENFLDDAIKHGD